MDHSNRDSRNGLISAGLHCPINDGVLPSRFPIYSIVINGQGSILIQIIRDTYAFRQIQNRTEVNPMVAGMMDLGWSIIENECQISFQLRYIATQNGQSNGDRLGTFYGSIRWCSIRNGQGCKIL